MILATLPGYPRIGRQRELKRACEAHWRGALSAADLLATTATLRRDHWLTQQAAGINLLPVNDFSLYDHVLDAIALVGAVPERYAWSGDVVDLPTYFAMARGSQSAALDVTAMAMTKWFNTNYHYIVPEWRPGQRFRLASTKPFDELAEARALGVAAKPVLLGPFSLSLLGRDAAGAPLATIDTILDGIVEVYAQIIARLAADGAEWIQLDEPCLVQDRSPAELAGLRRAYAALAASKGGARLLLQTYFGHVGEAFAVLAELPVDGLGLDFVHGRANLELVRRHSLPADKVLVAGVVDGRNVWGTDLATTLDTLESIAGLVPRERLFVSSSCSLLHVPYDVRREADLPFELRAPGRLAFAEQKLSEIAALARGLSDGRAAIAAELEASSSAHSHAAAASMRQNHQPAPSEPLSRPPYAERAALQHQLLQLPPLPTTTIGSFPQTADVRRLRQRLDAGAIDEATYTARLEEAVADVIALQERTGLDVLVHGEFERNDMVQYFGEQLSGIATTQLGWVQSYGSRYVRPPIIYADVTRPAPMTVHWSAYAQSLTSRPVKAMLSGPVTILNWSFVRDDQSRSQTCVQIARALRDEVGDLEAAGLRIIQVDEPALREGLPLRRSEWAAYLDWATACFRLTTSAASAATQIHSHMCYSAVDDILDAISALDADVLSIENARSGGALLRSLRGAGYDKSIGPGVYDIHSPRVPAQAEIESLLHAALPGFGLDRLWVNPDCGLKTRTWSEVTPSLERMVAAARSVRASDRVST